MTREEAIAILEVSKHMATSGRMYNQAIDMAIEALSEAQVDVGLINKDAVSREGLLKSWEELSPRGRAILKDKAINLEPNRSEQAYATQERLNSYLEHSRAFARTCEDINKGLKEEELEQIEFIREQFEKLARITLEELIRLA